MKQSRWMSLLESGAKTGLGLVTGLVYQLISFPLVGINVPLSTNFKLGIFFGLTGILQNFLLRRYFEYIRVNGKPAWIVACQSALTGKGEGQ